MGAAGCRACGQASSDSDEIHAKGQTDPACFAPDLSPSTPSGSHQRGVAVAEDAALGADHLGQVAEKTAEEDARASGADEGAEETEAEAEARALLLELRALDAALRLEQDKSEASNGSNALRHGLAVQLRALGGALDRLRTHPELQAAGAMVASTEFPGLPETLLGVPGAWFPNSRSSAESLIQPEGCCPTKKDVLKIDFDLDEGCHVDIRLEFLPDNTAMIEWSAVGIPIPLPLILCLVHEIDLLGEIAPWIESCGVLHQFPANEADRLVRIVSKPPIPFVPGFEAVAQRYGFDLLDTPWQAMCLVESSPAWQKAEDASASAREQWRGVPRPPPYQKGLKEVDVKTIVALARPAGQKGERTVIIFSGKGDLKVPRWLLPNSLLSLLVKTIAKFVYQKALDRVAQFDSSEHGRRLKGSSFYAKLHSRIAQHLAAKAKAPDSGQEGEGPD